MEDTPPPSTRYGRTATPPVSHAVSSIQRSANRLELVKYFQFTHVTVTLTREVRGMGSAESSMDLARPVAVRTKMARVPAFPTCTVRLRIINTFAIPNSHESSIQRTAVCNSQPVQHASVNTLLTIRPSRICAFANDCMHD